MNVYRIQGSIDEDNELGWTEERSGAKRSSVGVMKMAW